MVPQARRPEFAHSMPTGMNISLRGFVTPQARRPGITHSMPTVWKFPWKISREVTKSTKILADSWLICYSFTIFHDLWIVLWCRSDPDLHFHIFNSKDDWFSVRDSYAFFVYLGLAHISSHLYSAPRCVLRVLGFGAYPLPFMQCAQRLSLCTSA